MINFQENLKPIFKKYPILFAYLFGSQARKKISALSNIDIAVYFDKKISRNERFKLRYDIQDEIEAKLKVQEKVDIIPLNDATPLLEREIVYKGKPIYSKAEAERVHYEAGAIGRWLDWKWYEDQFNKAIEKQFLKPIEAYGK